MTGISEPQLFAAYGFSESDSARQRREEHERLLEQVGVESDEGQRLLQVWAKENAAASRRTPNER